MCPWYCKKQISKLDRDIELCKKCIIHWGKVVEGVEEPTGAACDFCKEYSTGLIPRNLRCMKCPIFLDTKKHCVELVVYKNAVDEYDVNINISIKERTKMLNCLKDLLRKLISKKYDYDKVMQDKTVIHCDTKEKAKDLLEWADACGLKWCNGENYVENLWDDGGKYQCYDLKQGEHSRYGFYKKENYTIIAYEDVRINTGDSYTLKDKKSTKISDLPVYHHEFIPEKHEFIKQLESKCDICKNEFELVKIEKTYGAGTKLRSKIKDDFDEYVIVLNHSELNILNKTKWARVQIKPIKGRSASFDKINNWSQHLEIDN